MHIIWWRASLMGNVFLWFILCVVCTFIIVLKRTKIVLETFLSGIAGTACQLVYKALSFHPRMDTVCTVKYLSIDMRSGYENE